MTEDNTNRSVKEILENVGDVAEDVIRVLVDKCAWLLESEEVKHYVSKIYKQWKLGDSLTNPLITFTNELKGGYYDALDEGQIDDLHQAALDLSGLWMSESQIDIESMKSNAGHLLIQEILANLFGNLKMGNTDVRSAFEEISWDRRYGRPC